MAGLVKSPIQTVVVEGIYNDILTKNAQYYYFLGRTNKWTVADGASPGEDGTWTTIGSGAASTQVLNAPEPQGTFRYELDTRNNILTYKLVKPSDVSFVAKRYNWTSGTVYDMYDDSYSLTNRAYSGATRLEDAKFYCLTSLNNVYKCISNNYDAKSTVEPSGTSSDDFTTSDGYIWKFMYNIPVALQNKFYTYDYIPVMTSLRNRFYENGAIGSVAVQDPGSGYTNATSLSISGDGFLENNPYSVGSSSVLTVGGSGYKPTLAITSATWLTGVATITCTSHGFIVGDKITIRGITPTGYNGNYTVATVPTANTLTVAITNDPGIYVSGGSLSKDILTFSAPLWGNAKTQASGYCTISGTGVITAITMDQKIGPGGATVYGYGYDQTGTVVIQEPFVPNFQWSAGATYAVNQIVEANFNYYKVTTAGTMNNTLPIHTSGTVTFGTCALLYIGSQAFASMILTKTEAIMTPIIQGGSITGVQIQDGGVGYTYCNIIPQDTPPNFSATLTPDITIGNIDTVQANVELMAQGRAGAISYIKMAKDPITGQYKNGAGYGVDTSIVISGDGTGATAEPVIVNGSIVGIRLTNPGTGYKREANVKIYPLHLDGNGKYIGAEARAILSPPGAHGSNAIHELFSSTILFYSILSDERIHMIPNFNDYRQFGVVKNPKRYGSTSRVSTTSATACWLITSTSNININNFKIDDEIYQGGEELYRVVSIQNDKMVIQAVTQSVPTTANFINKGNSTTGDISRVGNTLNVKTITTPQVDKFTGDILFIDNKLPFVVTTDQMITFRTTISAAV